MDPRVKPGGDTVWARGDASLDRAGAEFNSPRSRGRVRSRRNPWHRSRLGRKAQAAGGLERLGVEGADLDRAAHIERHRDAVLGHRGADDARALRQQRGHVRRCASLRLENAIADDADDRGDCHQRGGAGDQHQPAHLRDHAGGRGIEGRCIVRRELRHGLAGAQRDSGDRRR